MGKKKISQFPPATPVSGDKFLIEKADGTYKNVDFDDLASATPSLQDVTDVGSTTTNAIDANGFNSKDVSNVINSYIDSTGIYVFNSSFSGSNLLEVDRVNDIIRYLGVQVATVNDVVNVDVNTIGTAVNGAASATPNDTDLVMSVDTSVAKKNTWTQIKSFLKTYFDTLYPLKSNNLSDLTNVNTARNNLKEWDLIITTGNQTTTSNVATNITDLVTPTLAANKRYKISGCILVTCSGTGGVKFQVTVPTGATLSFGFTGNTSNQTAFGQYGVAASATLTGTALCTNSSFGALIQVNGEVSLSSTAGTIQFGFASGTNTQTSTIYQLNTHITVKQLD